MAEDFEYEFRMIGLKIAYYRKAHNPPLTQEQLAELSNISDRHVRNLESYCKNPSSTVLCRISHALDVPMEELMTIVPE